MTNVSYGPALRELAEFSAGIGKDPLLVQGAGGNTSLKENDTLWVKASGFWLADALSQNIFAPVPLGPVRAAITEDPTYEAVNTTINGSARNGIRPSIETSLHVLLPHRIVVHVHAIDVMADLVRTDGEHIAAQKLSGLSWAWVPYARPGTPLTAAVCAAFSGQPPDILLLQNHGLVIGASSVVAAEQLLTEIQRRLHKPSRIALEACDSTAATATVEFLKKNNFRPARHNQVHSLANDPVSLAYLARGVFYPDQVVFLGPAPTIVPRGTALPAESEALFLVVEGVGVFIREPGSPALEEMLLCHALLLAKLPKDAPVRTLDSAEISALMNWDAEKYRQQLQIRG